MKIYGAGQLKFPGTSRVVWDFEDGPFETVNPVLISEARRRGYSFEPPAPIPVVSRKKPGPKAKPDKEASKGKVEMK